MHYQPLQCGLFEALANENGVVLNNTKTNRSFYFTNLYQATRFLMFYYRNPFSAEFAYELTEKENT